MSYLQGPATSGSHSYLLVWKGQGRNRPCWGLQQGVGATLQGLHSRDQPLPGKGAKLRQGGGGGRHISWSLFIPVLWVLYLHQTQREVRGQRSPSRKVRGNEGGGMGLMESDVKWLLDYLTSQGHSPSMAYDSHILVFWTTIPCSI